MFQKVSRIEGRTYMGGQDLVDIETRVERALEEFGAVDHPHQIPSDLPLDFRITITVEYCE